MGIHAYRQITEPTLADEATFSLWHDQAVFEQLEDLPGTKIMGSEFDIDYIKLQVASVEELLESNPFDANMTEALQKDLQAARANGQTRILYHCH